MMSALMIFLVATFTCPTIGFGVSTSGSTTCSQTASLTSSCPSTTAVISTTTDLNSALETYSGGNDGDINAWDVSNVEDMSQLSFDPSFNLDIRCWNTAKVTRMDGMFIAGLAGTAFNQDINSWNTAKVTTMHYMFYKASFNQDINSWNTGAVTKMDSMFAEASAFNQDIDCWNTAKVTTMGSMFLGAGAFSQILTWNTDALTTQGLSGVFSGSSGSWA